MTVYFALKETRTVIHNYLAEQRLVPSRRETDHTLAMELLANLNESELYCKWAGT